ncbi:MAG: hypothetical protein GTO28_08760 [Gammaproteobacteria bacterium]|nr:hypothetical protein [Gammaproteobacteria bacterium]NIM73268.1 hypothetical protein [Gammaproteobacteria bacterium]NIO24969.1 hypothetical protein [Gammaproteobacteria bacterium]NIO65571.1 hypothetical protein [Gammaproteobacteria bacterium]NIP64421.1 hypothetical protein [Gammaproteobacteria bacterium]
MSCKSRWRRGDDELTGTSGRDFIFSGRGDDRIDALGGNDFIWAGRGRDVIDGGDGGDWIWAGSGDDEVHAGAGDDRVWCGRGDDTVVHSLSENDGARDFYHGGRGNDLIVLEVTHAEHTAELQADFDAFEAFLALPGEHWKQHAFHFKSIGLTVKSFERFEIRYTDELPLAPINAPPVAESDTVLVDMVNDPIQEVEPNDPNGIPLSTSAQVIDRASFRIAPSSDVGNDALPRVSIHGTISGSFPIFGPAANDVDLYAITLQAGEKLILDIDHAYVTGSQMNAQLFLMDESGAVLAESDNAGTDLGGGGSSSPFDPYLEYTDAGSGGTYYVAVSAFDNDPGFPGYFDDGGVMPGDYVLNISIDNAADDIGAFVISAQTLLGNDSDADGDALVITRVGNAVNGSVELSAGGDILFRPNSLSPGAFDYTVSDGNGGEATATVTVNGNPLIGTADADVLDSTGENDFIVSGGGNDIINFATGSGKDTIADFTPGSDRMAITDGMAVADIRAQGNDTLVLFDTGDSALVVGVSGVTDASELFG